MKKILSILMTPLLLTLPVLTATSCKGERQLEITLVPSKNSAKMNKIKPKFRELIEKKLKEIDKDFKLKVNVKSTENYAMTAQGLASGTAAIAFLQTKLHCDNRGVEQADGTYDKIGVLLKSTRQGISAEKENDKNIQSDWSETISAKESWTIVKNYNQLSQNINSKKDVQDKMFVKNDNTDTEYYRSCIYANKDFLNQNGFDKIQTEQDYINNDGIQYSRIWFKNDQTLLKNLRKAFKELVQDPANHEIFNDIYSHKNYIAPDENASQTDITNWEANVEKTYTAIEKKFKNINDLIIASTVR